MPNKHKHPHHTRYTRLVAAFASSAFVLLIMVSTIDQTAQVATVVKYSAKAPVQATDHAVKVLSTTTVTTPHVSASAATTTHATHESQRNTQVSEHPQHSTAVRDWAPGSPEPVLAKTFCQFQCRTSADITSVSYCPLHTDARGACPTGAWFEIPAGISENCDELNGNDCLGYAADGRQNYGKIYSSVKLTYAAW